MNRILSLILLICIYTSCQDDKREQFMRLVQEWQGNEHRPFTYEHGKQVWCDIFRINPFFRENAVCGYLKVSAHETFCFSLETPSFMG